jgi:hypothetical protein
MPIGFFVVSIGPSANPELLSLTARAVERLTRAQLPETLHAAR